MPNGHAYILDFVVDRPSKRNKVTTIFLPEVSVCKTLQVYYLNLQKQIGTNLYLGVHLNRQYLQVLILPKLW